MFLSFSFSMFSSKKKIVHFLAYTVYCGYSFKEKVHVHVWHIQMTMDPLAFVAEFCTILKETGK